LTVMTSPYHIGPNIYAEFCTPVLVCFKTGQPLHYDSVWQIKHTTSKTNSFKISRIFVYANNDWCYYISGHCTYICS